MWRIEGNEATGRYTQVYVVDKRSQYLDKIPQVVSSCLEREVANERHSVLPRPVEFQLVRVAHVAVVSAVAG
jgi:hypothetical protein